MRSRPQRPLSSSVSLLLVTVRSTMRLSFLACLPLLVTPVAYGIDAAPNGSWVPVVEFQLEDADFSHTLNWVAGWSFALTAVSNEQAHVGGKLLFCPSGGAN